jgi:hypothetical protein
MHHIDIVEPTNKTVWVAGSNESIVIRWGVDPDPVHSIHFDLSVVGSKGDADRIFRTILPNRTSAAKNGQKEWFNFTLSSSTPATRIAAVRLIYYSPSMPGLNDSQEFTILNPRDPATEIDVRVVPDQNRVYSGESLYASAFASVCSAPLWLTNFTLSTDIGSLSKPGCRADLAGECRFQLFAPTVTHEAWATITTTAEHSQFAANSSTARVLVIPLGGSPVFAYANAEPSVILGGERSTFKVGVQNATSPIPGAAVVPALEWGSIAPERATTDAQGVATFTFTSPPVDADRNGSVRFYVSPPASPPLNTSAQVLVRPAIPPLAVVWTYPEEGATGVPRDVAVRFAFTRAARHGETLDSVVFAPQVDQVAINGTETVVWAKPANPLRASSTYRVTIAWKELDPRDGGQVPRSFTVQFATEAPTSSPHNAPSQTNDPAVLLGGAALAGVVIGLVAWMVWLRMRKARRAAEARRRYESADPRPDRRREATRRAAARARAKK